MNTEEYRAKAEHCRHMADQVLSPIEREMCLQLAAEWLQIASIRERFGIGQTKRDTHHQA